MKKNALIRAYAVWALITVFLVIPMARQAGAAVSGPTHVTIKRACISMPDGTVSAPTGAPAATCPAGTIKMWLPADSNAVAPDPGLLAPGSFVITADQGDNLTITLKNELTIPVSLTIPGQVLSNNTGPVWFADIANPYGSATQFGSRPAPSNAADPEDPAFKYRVRSFSHETPAGAPGAPGPETAYTWNNLKPGTYLILSGTHPSLQVQMGIYGILIVRAAGGGPYAGIAAPAQEVTLLFSEIDPAIHNGVDDAAMVASPPTIPSTNIFFPKYFLINGKAFPGNDPIPIGAAGSRTLLRFANAGLDTYIPQLQGQSMQVIAEDGYLKPAILRPADGSLNRYSVDLHAGKTFDGILTNPAAGYIPLYDRRLFLSNATKTPGGMLIYLEVGGPGPNALTVATAGGAGTERVAAESLPGGIYCNSLVAGSNCTQDYFEGTEIKLVGYPTPNSWTGCDSVTGANDCLVTMDTAKNVTANYTGAPSADSIIVTSPNGGESFTVGNTMPITWTYTGNPGALVKIQLMQGTKILRSVTPFRGTSIGSGGAGSFTWKIPPYFRKTGSDFKIKITSKTNAAVTDTSDNTFRITK
jgi:hypothetical protein